ncbi:MAG: hypothetical protein P1U58_21020 [Verrucomicrobiales bacterium]|nr:hypothetical protein [Verrucomicrobiales bacterium]
MKTLFPFLIIPALAFSVFSCPGEDRSWIKEDSVEAFQFSTPIFEGVFVAHDARELGKGFGKHGLRKLTYKGQDLHAPESKVGAKRRHQGILNLYRIYSANESFGSLRDYEAQVEKLDNGARLSWQASEERPVAISATWRLTGPAQIDLTIEATPTRSITNFELLPATYTPLEMVQGVYLGDPEAPQLTILRPTAESDENETYPFYPLGEKARKAQEETGRLHSDWTWPTFVASETAALPIVFAENESIQVIQFADPDSTSAVCVTPTPESGDPSDWNKVEQHSALYFSLFGHDVAAGTSYHSHIRFLVIDRPGNTEAVHLKLYREFLSTL